MKICLVGPGIMSIPPVGWGAVEILIWDIKCTLEENFGHEVVIVNTQNRNDIIKEVNQHKPDFVHVQYDEFVDVFPHINFPKAITSHYGYLEQPQKYGGYMNLASKFVHYKPNIFCLSQGIKDIYKNKFRMDESRLFVTPNGVNNKLFQYKEEVEQPNCSIYLAKIDFRKRQYQFQDVEGLYFAGNIADNRFVVNDKYLGEWNKEHLYNNLTNYSNLVLLSDGEAHPLVCMEALCSGLGLVISEFATANLDLSKEFITVIKEQDIGNIDLINQEVKKNREISNKMRKEIKEYSKQFYWENIIKTHYIPSIESVISGK